MNYSNIAKDTIKKEIDSINYILSNFNENIFNDIVNLILSTKGRVVITGMGKSGHIGKKIAATLASTGTPSFFMHPAEAFHGDLGMLTADDILLAISNSGESEEIVKLIPIIKKMNIILIGMTGNLNSTLSKYSDYCLDISIKEEACPLGLAPMSSTTVTLVMGDALASALMVAKNFKPENFALFHPGGSLGRKLLTRVKDIMHSRNLPIVGVDSSFQEVITKMTSGKLGLCIVMENDNIKGLITDGDLRRTLQRTDKIRFDLSAQEMMTKNPKVIHENKMAVDAEAYMIENKIKELLVVDDNEKLVGIVQLFDTGSIF